MFQIVKKNTIFYMFLFGDINNIRTFAPPFKKGNDRNDQGTLEKSFFFVDKLIQ